MLFFSGITGFTTLAGVNGNGQVLTKSVNRISQGSAVLGGAKNTVTAVAIAVADVSFIYTFTDAVDQICTVGSLITIAAIGNAGAGNNGSLNGSGTIAVVNNNQITVNITGGIVGRTVGATPVFTAGIVTVTSADTIVVGNIGTGVTIGNAPDYGSAIVNDGDDKLLLVGTIGNGVVVGNAPDFTASTTTIAADGNTIINQPMDIRVFGEVEKAIVPNSKGGYNVVYV
jgi:hypothetical protein